jgi:hypothetical protein
MRDILKFSLVIAAILLPASAAFAVNAFVGIGTTAPTVKLQITGDAGAAGSTWANNGLVFEDTHAGGRNFSLSSRANTFMFGDETAGIVRMVIGGSGNVGIGTASPAFPLEVNGYIGLGTRLLMNVDGLNYAWLQARGSGSDADRVAVGFGADPTTGLVDSVSLSTNGQHRVFVDNAGHVGIGTTSPANMVDIVSATQYRGVAVGNGANPVAQLLGLAANNDNGAVALYNAGSKNVQIVGSGDTYINGGNVGIGTTFPGTKLEVAGGIKPGAATRGASCAGNVEGSFGYDATAHAPVYCSNGGLWAAIGRAAGTAGAPCTISLAWGFPNNTGVTMFEYAGNASWPGARYCCGVDTYFSGNNVTQAYVSCFGY